MGQSPSWEANGFPASQEISRILWNPNVHNRNHRSSQTVPVLSVLYPNPREKRDMTVNSKQECACRYGVRCIPKMDGFHSSHLLPTRAELLGIFCSVYF